MSYTILLTGLPCAGKTTLARPLSKRIGATFLDGDVIRDSYISPDVGFSPEDRRKHLLRIAEIAKLLNDSGTPVVASFVSPYASVREEMSEIIGPDRFYVSYVKAHPAECERRDVKGMWHEARRGNITGFTGFDAPYEPPENPDVMVETEYETEQESLGKLVAFAASLSATPRCSVYIGRWSPFHRGHYEIINQSLSKGEDVLILIRNTPLSEDDPWTAHERLDMLNSVFGDNESVHIRVIPDVKSVNIGRKVGYEVNRIEVTESIKQISGTDTRNSITEGTDEWRENVLPQVEKWIDSN